MNENWGCCRGGWGGRISNTMQSSLKRMKTSVRTLSWLYIYLYVSERVAIWFYSTEQPSTLFASRVHWVFSLLWHFTEAIFTYLHLHNSLLALHSLPSEISILHSAMSVKIKVRKSEPCLQILIWEIQSKRALSRLMTWRCRKDPTAGGSVRHIEAQARRSQKSNQFTKWGQLHNTFPIMLNSAWNLLDTQFCRNIVLGSFFLLQKLF